jgi:hypothetical protein
MRNIRRNFNRIRNKAQVLLNLLIYKIRMGLSNLRTQL